MEKFAVHSEDNSERQVNATSQEKEARLETSEELEAFRKELEPIFDDRFITLGHGTIKEAAEAILSAGLRSQAPDIRSTALGLKNTDEGLKQILNWPHFNHKAIVVIMVPRNKQFDQSQVWGKNEVTNNYATRFTLSPQFIRGYIDVEVRKLILNDKFEENPIIKERVKIDEKQPIHSRKKEGVTETVNISDKTDGEDVW